MKKKTGILIIGISERTKMIIHLIERENKYSIIGLIEGFGKIDKILGYEVLGTIKHIPELQKEYGIFEGIITGGSNYERAKWVNEIENECTGFQFLSVIHPSAIIGKNVCIGIGTLVWAGVIINAEAKIGNFCILDTYVTIGHDCVLEDFTSVSSKSTLGGGTTLQTFSSILTGVNIIQNITIGEHTIIESGSTVIGNIKNRKIAFGIPAKEIHSISKKEF